jgi:hypothetical protein
MLRIPQRFLPVTGLIGLLASTALPASASSSIAAEGSSASSTSVGSSSTSVGKSSDSSSGKDKAVAEGDYRVIEVAAVVDQPGKLRVRLQATADDSVDGELLLTLPQAAVARGQLASGAVISARNRAYGVEFAAAATREPFFLVMRDDWFRELDSKPVTL